MKTPIFIGCALFFASAAQAQLNAAPSIQSDFKAMSTYGGKNTGYQTIATYSSGNVKGSQFFYQGFLDGSVTTTSNQVLIGIYQFLFDKVRQEVFITSKSDTRNPPEVLLAEKQQIKTFTLTTDRDHTFATARIYDPTNVNDFYEVLKKDDSGYTLLKFVKTTFVKMDYRDMEKVKRGDLYDEFVDKVTYLLSYKSGKPTEISFKRKNITNAFNADKRTFVDNYFNNHFNDEVNEQFLVNLVDAANK